MGNVLCGETHPEKSMCSWGSSRCVRVCSRVVGRVEYVGQLQGASQCYQLRGAAQVNLEKLATLVAEAAVLLIGEICRRLWVPLR